ncbi:hypothetical protein ACOME3_009847 [Neoechinorhynchus agilis]
MNAEYTRIDFVLLCTNQSNVSVPQMVELLLERLKTSSWIVTFKALITIHHLMNSGNERFEACIASYSQRFQLGQFWDRSSLTGFEMSTHIRKYAAYLDGKREAYRINGFDLCRIKRGREDGGTLARMPFEKLSKVTPIIQTQIDAITGFTLTSVEIMNSIVCAACYLMFKDIIRLYACYNDAMTTVLECFFDLRKPQCKEALEMYRGFILRSDSVTNFLKTAENFGTQRNEIPDLKKAPESLLATLETYCASLEGTSGPRESQHQRVVPSELVTKPITGINVDEQIKAIEDEAKAISLFEQEHQKRKSPQMQSIVKNDSDLGHHEDLLDLDFEIPSTMKTQEHKDSESTVEDLFATLEKNPSPSALQPTFIQSNNPFVSQEATDPMIGLHGAAGKNPFKSNEDQSIALGDLEAFVRTSASQFSKSTQPSKHTQGH